MSKEQNIYCFLEVGLNAQFLRARFYHIWKNGIFFILSIDGHMYKDTLCQKLEKSSDANSFNLQKCAFFGQNWRFFENNGSKSSRSEIWLKYKIVPRQIGTCLGTKIFRFGPPVQTLHLGSKKGCHRLQFDPPNMIYKSIFALVMKKTRIGFTCLWLNG